MSTTGKSLALSETNQAVGKPLTTPTWVSAATQDTWPGEFNTSTALAKLDDAKRASIPGAAQALKLMVTPMDEKRRVQRLTALGMVMAPNRPAADASMWVRETARLLSDIAEDVLCAAIDTLQKRLKFLPTVAEIREIADPVMDERRRQFARIDAMRRYVESGNDLPKYIAPPTPKERQPDKPMTAAEIDEFNRIMANLGLATRYRNDGSRYEVSTRTPEIQRPQGPPQMPTRADYIAMGVDPAVLDSLEAEKRQAA